MNYKTPKDKKLICATVAFCSPVVKGCVQHILKKEGYSWETKEKGWEEFFEITVKNRSDTTVQFFLHNLYLEIATKDRDDELLEWDMKLFDFSFFREKVIRIIFEKIRPLFIALSTDDTEKLKKKLRQFAKDEGFRMRMAIFDENKGSENENKRRKM